MYKVIDSMWFSTYPGIFGIVVSEDDSGVRKLTASVVKGINRQEDEKYVISHGTTVNPNLLRRLIAKMGK